MKIGTGSKGASGKDIEKAKQMRSGLSIGFKRRIRTHPSRSEQKSSILNGSRAEKDPGGQK